MNPHTKRRRTRLALAAAALSVPLGSGLGYAYWQATATGSGSAATGTLQTVTVAALVDGDTPDTSLVPGGSADVIVRLHNPNSFAVEVYGVTPAGPVTADANHPACTDTGVSFTAPASPVGDTVPAGDSTLVRLPGAASMSTASSAGCQGATFQIPVTVTVRR